MNKQNKSKKNKTTKIERGRLYIQATFNNTIISVTDDSGNVLAWSSAGLLGFKGARKATAYAAQIATKSVLDKIKSTGMTSLRVYVAGVGSGRESAIRSLHGYDFEITSLKDITPIPHNGCRPKKPRRV